MAGDEGSEKACRKGLEGGYLPFFLHPPPTPAQPVLPRAFQTGHFPWEGGAGNPRGAPAIPLMAKTPEITPPQPSQTELHQFSVALREVKRGSILAQDSGAALPHVT